MATQTQLVGNQIKNATISSDDLDKTSVDIIYPNLTTTRTAKTFLAAPTAGNGQASFRTIVAADLPTVTVVSCSYALEANHCLSADGANFATSALSATSCTSASYAYNSTSASHALNADNAITSGYANTANTAAYASNANTAAYASTANSSSHALKADTALNAGSAASADYAESCNDAQTAISSSYSLTSSYARNALSAAYAPSSGGGDTSGWLNININGWTSDVTCSRQGYTKIRYYGTINGNGEYGLSNITQPSNGLIVYIHNDTVGNAFNHCNAGYDGSNSFYMAFELTGADAGITAGIRSFIYNSEVSGGCWILIR